MHLLVDARMCVCFGIGAKKGQNDSLIEEHSHVYMQRNALCVCVCVCVCVLRKYLSSPKWFRLYPRIYIQRIS